VGKAEKAEPEYKWLRQTPQTATLASIREGQAQLPQRTKRAVHQPDPQTGKKTQGTGQPRSPFGIVLLKEKALYPTENSE